MASLPEPQRLISILEPFPLTERSAAQTRRMITGMGRTPRILVEEENTDDPDEAQKGKHSSCASAAGRVEHDKDIEEYE